MTILLPPSLKSLEAEFTTWNPVQNCIHRGKKLHEAQGVMFDCPCGKHSIMVWFRNPHVLPAAGEGAPPNDKRWELVSGTDLDDLTLSPSILLDCWHGFVVDGHAKSV
jgi:hypothetical protein